jgi:hypothetical protein
MRKFALSIIFFFILLAVSASSSLAAFRLSLSQLPDYKNTDNFRIYYTYLETSGKNAIVNLYVQKEGKDWRQTKDHDKTAVSGYFQIEGADIFDGEGKYHFYAKAVIEGVEQESSATITTIVDRSAPSNVTDYRKERVSANDFKLYWKCPGDADVGKTYIYRSKETSFTADSTTRIQEIVCSPNESKITTVVGEGDTKYYFALRAIDHAGNASGVVTDAPGEVIAGEVAGASTQDGTGGPLDGSQLAEGRVVKLPKEGSGEDESESGSDGELGGGISSEAGEVKGESEKKSSSKFWLVGVGAGALLVLGYLSKRKRS